MTEIVSMSADQNVPVQAAEHRGKRILLRLKAFIKRLIACKPMNDVQREIETQNELKTDTNLVAINCHWFRCYYR